MPFIQPLPNLLHSLGLDRKLVEHLKDLLHHIDRQPQLPLTRSAHPVESDVADNPQAMQIIDDPARQVGS